MPRNGFVTRDILLSLLVAGGAITIAAMVPGITLLLKQREYGRKQIVRSLRHLVDTRQISITEGRDTTTITLSRQGKSRAISYRVNEMTIPHPKKWDGRWWLVLFDIPEKQRLARHVLRDKLKALGFVRFQKSAWLFPFECRKQIEFLSHLYEVNRYVKVLKVAQLPETEKQQLKHRFNLS